MLTPWQGAALEGRGTYPGQGGGGGGGANPGLGWQRGGGFTQPLIAVVGREETSLRIFLFSIKAL